jgi:hypothetical protein
MAAVKRHTTRLAEKVQLRKHVRELLAVEVNTIKLQRTALATLESKSIVPYPGGRLPAMGRRLLHRRLLLLPGLFAELRTAQYVRWVVRFRQLSVGRSVGRSVVCDRWVASVVLSSIGRETGTKVQQVQNRRPPPPILCEPEPREQASSGLNSVSSHPARHHQRNAWRLAWEGIRGEAAVEAGKSSSPVVSTVTKKNAHDWAVTKLIVYEQRHRALLARQVRPARALTLNGPSAAELRRTDGSWVLKKKKSAQVEENGTHSWKRLASHPS